MYKPSLSPGSSLYHTLFMQRRKGKASSAFKYQYPQFLPKATSPVKEALPEHLLTKTTTTTPADKLLLGHYQPEGLQHCGPGTMQFSHWRAKCLLEKYSATPYFTGKKIKYVIKYLNFKS